ncbi:methionine--tRNA ligase [Candidatus Nomurabacteria bacterium RIFCSPLOWO2_02_40_28]|nr:MAG: methionine--tRNA ligase [Candidatus Nomurabacteria bacterium RIFCSPHIGHO2_02_40_30]OGI79643.1 MAG: methionine--tRNA ligase [Candidatus Nomurabacteria bacterium RIFCSPHIGHO2_12_40_11]OGI82495.1 MAG: methionine--tRNA ligase [Candidatus Nomurabacteria bacterium RIFCSPHIGHO2_12_FULL_40_77]OGI96740.1 MAG: methionine--tRNA ligase [Candidatus Nomurabacteria bacterium RIFCSPLOWO2_02_40_28]OGI99309.1 MAG: methionine--tRNA ligase [Candidatus Nomurabacteria bacterium RIFCSPLOWO2_12_40_14]HBA46172
MNEKKPFYITTTIPYVNADPHIGFALELVQADAMARYHRLLGRDVFFSTGTDEHGQKILEASEREGKNVKDYVDHYAQKFLELKDLLNLSNDNFIRTTNPEHVKAAQAFWRLCDQKGDIYKKIYRGLYCVGCEKFITEKDLMDGFCSFHPNKKPEIVEEENYFFRLSNYKKQLLEYLSNEKTIIPKWRRIEAIDYVSDGMEDFSISRDKKRFSWGVPVPNDDTQVMYVWFDALVNYLSTLGWPNSHGIYEKFWENGEKVQVAGKDMVKFQSVMWQGMLMSAGLPTTDSVVYHGFITGEGGIKMSKSIGNVINPNEIVKEYGTDALRYFLLREISTFEDSPFTMERFKEAYNANLANGLGNLVSRILTMVENYAIRTTVVGAALSDPDLDVFDIKKYMDKIWLKIQELDKIIQEKEPYKVFKTNPEEAKIIVADLFMKLASIGYSLKSIMPETSQHILSCLSGHKKPETPLFPRKD